jgi:hypothetical protein
MRAGAPTAHSRPRVRSNRGAGRGPGSGPTVRGQSETPRAEPKRDPTGRAQATPHRPSPSDTPQAEPKRHSTGRAQARPHRPSPSETPQAEPKRHPTGRAQAGPPQAEQVLQKARMAQSGRNPAITRRGSRARLARGLEWAVSAPRTPAAPLKDRRGATCVTPRRLREERYCVRRRGYEAGEPVPRRGVS